MQVAYESRTEAAHHARNDRFAELDEMSFAELLSLEDDLSEGSQWSLLDDVRAELKSRLEDAEEALAKLFVEQCAAVGSIPMPDGGKVEPWTIDTYISVSIDAGWGSMAADALLGRIPRERLFAAMAEEYGEQQANDLLKAGYVPEAVASPRFPMVSCSQCGGDFGPGDSGFSHCSDHKHLRRVA